MNKKSEKSSAKQIIYALLVLSIFAFAVFISVIYIFLPLWNSVKSIDVNLAAGLATAFASVLSVLAGVALNKHLERKHATEINFRERKIEFYKEFLEKALPDIFGHEERRSKKTRKLNNSELVSFLRNWHARLIIWGGPDVLLKYIEWLKILKAADSSPKAKSMLLLCDFLLSIRDDLGLSNKGINRKTFVWIIMKHPEIFLNAVNINEETTLSEIEALEKNKCFD